MKHRPWIKPIEIHSPDEGNRQASWLELFVDLGFVVAVSSLTSILEEFSPQRLYVYGCLFFTIFWIWNRFTWYATYYDNGDVLFRVSYLLAVFLVVGIASTVESLLKQDYRAATLWYVGLDVILLFLWARVVRRGQQFGANARSFLASYAVGLLLMIISLWVPAPAKYACWIGAFLAEIIGPVIGWKKSNGKLPVQTSHIVEHHGLFTIILLGEGVVSVSKNFEHVASFAAGRWLLLAFLLVAALWWTYFDYGNGFRTDLSKNMQRTFVYGYGQFLVFVALALVTTRLEFGLHHLLSEQSSSRSERIFGGVLLIGAGSFLVVLSLIQLLISTINPSKVYVPRIVAGAGLLLVGVFVPQSSFATALLTCLAVFLVVVINDTYQWGRKWH